MVFKIIAAVEDFKSLLLLTKVEIIRASIFLKFQIIWFVFNFFLCRSDKRYLLSEIGFIQEILQQYLNNHLQIKELGRSGSE